MFAIIIAATAGVIVTSLVAYSLHKRNQPTGTEPEYPPAPVEQSASTPDLNNYPQVQNAKSKAKEIILAAQEQALEIKKQAESEAAKTRREVFELEKAISRREEQLELKLSSVEKRERQVSAQQRGVSKKLQDLEDMRRSLLRKLEQVAQMSRAEAREKILKKAEENLQGEIAKKIKEAEEAVKHSVDEKAREILVDAMHHGAHDYISQSTTSKIQLPQEEMKGRIIGKEGRNIKAFERATGVDVVLDETPQAIQISSFDAVRREIARVAMERLIADGRIQPARIEEFVAKAKKDVEKIVQRAGEDLCHQAKVFNLPVKLVSILGRFKFRTSYGQNLIDHTLEVVNIGVALAHEVGADVKTVRLACLLHDIGKVIADEEGTHVQLGVDLLNKYKLPKAVVDAVGEHHEDKPFSSVESIIVYLGDAISGARPGARFEDHETYMQRIGALEDAAQSFPEVAEAYAISAGREVRVIVKSDKITDAKIPILARAIADKIEQEQTYPGQVKVNVIRETRAAEVAR